MPGSSHHPLSYMIEPMIFGQFYTLGHVILSLSQMFRNNGTYRNKHQGTLTARGRSQAR